MINPEEVAICKRRGHKPDHYALHRGWTPCDWCGMWVREVSTIEEREDTPPESEQDSAVVMKRDLAKLKESAR